MERPHARLVAIGWIGLGNGLEPDHGIRRDWLRQRVDCAAPTAAHVPAGPPPRTRTSASYSTDAAVADSFSARPAMVTLRSPISRGTALTPRGTTSREAMLLAISDICAHLGEAFTGKSAGRKFMWRHMGHFLSPKNTAALRAFAFKLQPNFSFSFDTPAVPSQNFSRRGRGNPAEARPVPSGVWRQTPARPFWIAEATELLCQSGAGRCERIKNTCR
jgi:hypothetical protein